MNTNSSANGISKTSLRTGYIISALGVLFMLFDAILHVMNFPFVQESFKQLGYPTDLGVSLGIIKLVCLALYLTPRTRILGVILLTGYLGGAVATHVRLDNPLFSHTLFPVYIAILLWGGLYLRDVRTRELIRTWVSLGEGSNGRSSIPTPATQGR